MTSVSLQKRDGVRESLRHKHSLGRHGVVVKVRKRLIVHAQQEVRGIQMTGPLIAKRWYVSKRNARTRSEVGRVSLPGKPLN